MMRCVRQAWLQKPVSYQNRGSLLFYIHSVAKRLRSGYDAMQQVCTRCFRLQTKGSHRQTSQSFRLDSRGGNGRVDSAPVLL
jgi:hypothetical protein